MFKKVLLLLSVLLLATIAFTGCRRGDDDENFLRIWSFTDEVERHEVIFRGLNPDVTVEFAITDMDGGGYEEWVLTALAAGGDHVPDVIYLEAGFVLSFVEGPFLRNLNHMMPEVQALEPYQFVVDIGTADGELRAVSWQATPGVFFYRRSLARQIFGTDDPAAIQNYFRDWDTTLNSARRIRDTAENTFFTNTFGAWAQVFYANRTERWVENNRLTIDPILNQYMDFAYIVRNEGLDARVGNWSPDWFAAMSDDFSNEHGPAHIFMYVLPTWGLAHVIYANHGDTFGDWAMIAGPMSYQWGGTWLGVPRVANRPEMGEKFIRDFVLNADVLANWALGVYTNEYLRRIDPTIAEGVFQGGGDFVNSAVVVRRVTRDFDGSHIYNFLGGQNPYDIFGAAAPRVSLDHIQGTDAAIQGAFGEAVGQYVDGMMTRAEAMAFFADNVHAQIPTLQR